MSLWLRLLLWLLNAVGLCRPPTQHVVEGDRSPDWPRVRAEHLRKEPECQVCGTRENIDVHHIVPVWIDRFQELSRENLVSLCRPHHFLFGHLMAWSSVNERCMADVRQWQERIRNRPRRKITNAQLEKLMATHQPPQRWYDEEWEL